MDDRFSVRHNEFSAAFESIAWYNGHAEWLWEIADIMENAERGKYVLCPLETEEWFTDKHALWMMLVSAFGAWGTSIRSGWIEDTKGAAEFINEVTQRYNEMLYPKEE